MSIPDANSALSRPPERAGIPVVGSSEAAKISAPDPKLFLNRELSWLAFNERVFEEARDADAPLFERLKFLSIIGSNFDEFFMVRVAGLKQQILGHVAETPADGMLPGEQLAAISERVHAIIAEVDRYFENELLPLLAQAGLFMVPPSAFTAEQKEAARKHFAAQVFPALTPLAVDPGHPFPHLRNKSINIAVLLSPKVKRKTRQPREKLLAVVQVPAVLGRFVRLPGQTGQSFALLDELIEAHVADLFPGYDVRQTARFRVTRNSDLLVDEEESEDLLSTIQEELRRRDLGDAVRLQINAGASTELEGTLAKALELEERDIYRAKCPLQLADLMHLSDQDPRPELRVEPFVPALPKPLRDADSVFEVIAKRDILLHHPYESFDPVVQFFQQAAEDPEVVAIKQTLYRTSGDSPFVRALSRAAQNGKQVTAFVEIKARFDEANNIAWARRLEENGVHVVYGLIGLKTHCKTALVVRREAGAIRRYVHVGTGNYNPLTARQYTDLSLFTSRQELSDDVTALFNMLTGYSEPPHWKRLAVAPFDLQTRLVEMIAREAERARQGQPARIVAKMNSLVDPVAIRALYEASQAGVEIDLLVRGICCLRPGMEGVSERIRVTSVVDRFLEHSRVFAFGAGDKTEVYIASADWMPRNFHRRIEVMVPVEDSAIRARLLNEVLGVALRDNVKARRLGVDGSYTLPDAKSPRVRSQTVLQEMAKQAAEVTHDPILRPLVAPAV